MKKCSKCSELKPVEMFGKNKSRKDGLEYWCKLCKRDILNNCVKKYHENYYREHVKLSYHIVYLLPDHNYVGVTNNPVYRMSNHRKKGFNRNTDNWIELARFESREDALKREAEYHDKGYEGRAK